MTQQNILFGIIIYTYFKITTLSPCLTSISTIVYLHVTTCK